MLSEGRCAEYAARRLAEFARRCRKRGLAVTPQRLATIRALLGAAEHRRAVQFTFGCSSSVRTSRSPRYIAPSRRCVRSARRAKLRCCTTARYDGNLLPDQHVVCIRCRRIRDLEIPGRDRLLGGHSELSEFKLLGSLLEIQVLCALAAVRGQREANGTRLTPPRIAGCANNSGRNPSDSGTWTSCKKASEDTLRGFSS